MSASRNTWSSGISYSVVGQATSPPLPTTGVDGYRSLTYAIHKGLIISSAAARGRQNDGFGVHTWSFCAGGSCCYSSLLQKFSEISLFILGGGALAVGEQDPNAISFQTEWKLYIRSKQIKPKKWPRKKIAKSGSHPSTGRAKISRSVLSGFF